MSVQSASGFTSVATLPPGGGTLQRSPRDPDRVWITTSGSARSIRHTPEGWREESPTPGSDETFAAPTGVAENTLRSLPQWVKVTAGAVARLHEEKNREGNVLWICGANGLVRVDTARGFPAPVPFATQLHTTDLHEGDQLARGHKPLTFTFVALRHQLENAVTYQTRLIGLDDDWSEWSPQRERAFTNLPPDRYRFEVRARDADGQLSAPASLAFTVLAPWWRTPWAWLGYTIAGLGLVAGVVRLRTRSLRHRAARLEADIAQRTHALAQKNVELLRLNQLEFDDKVAARLAEEKARLEVLRYQLNPHFLFNTLASISSALPSAQSTARTMVERLASFCRLTLHRTDDREWTTLGEEMQLLRVYLEIEQSRWGDLLDVAIDCDEALEAERLPHFLLLPLVENALKYGRATSPDRVGLRLTARQEESVDGWPATSGRRRMDDAEPNAPGGRVPPRDVLVLEVSNTGTWIEPTEKKTVSSLGIGLDNLRERLTRYYPRTHALTRAHADGWVTVTLRLTARSAPPAA